LRSCSNKRREPIPLLFSQNGLSAIENLHSIRYRYKEGHSMGITDREEHIGFVAQEVQKVIPEAVSENSRGYLLVNNDPILWAMLNAIHEQQKEIAQLRVQLKRGVAAQAHLTSRVHQLENSDRATPPYTIASKQRGSLKDGAQ
jgi:hypothetical protein